MKKQLLCSLLILTGIISAAEEEAALGLIALARRLVHPEGPPPLVPLNYVIQRVVQGPLTQAVVAAIQQETVAEKNYKCPTCNKTFMTKNGLNLHKKTHNKDEWLSCKYCTKSFSRKYKLIEHIRTHTGEKPYACDHPGCNKKFIRNEELTIHKRTHTGARPFGCDKCPKTFISSSNLSTHKITHTEERPFKCDQCDKTFKTTWKLKEHKATHTGVKTHACNLPDCPAIFARKHDLTKHRDRHMRRISKK